jgi:hypothetical protein
MAGAVIKLLEQWPLENSGMVFDSLEGRKSNFSITKEKKDQGKRIKFPKEKIDNRCSSQP